MSEGGIGDLSKIVSLIMENPKLIEEISNLAKNSNTSTDEPKESTPSTEAVESAAEPSVPAAAIPSRSNGAARAQLLGALKPYVSAQRAGAIDSMLSIADILDMMRSR
ncbi:MAG: hypothetical protein IJW03_03770 [Clostridia bacterium]|nr:hypothetical protein [Clostridia bacterium]